MPLLQPLAQWVVRGHQLEIDKVEARRDGAGHEAVLATTAGGLPLAGGHRPLRLHAASTTSAGPGLPDSGRLPYRPRDDHQGRTP